jgi:hypothetical protein
MTCSCQRRPCSCHSHPPQTKHRCKAAEYALNAYGLELLNSYRRGCAIQPTAGETGSYSTPAPQAYGPPPDPAGLLYNTPVNNAPVNSAPVNSAPVNSAPVNSAPVNNAASFGDAYNPNTWASASTSAPTPPQSSASVPLPVTSTPTPPPVTSTASLPTKPPVTNPPVTKPAITKPALKPTTGPPSSIPCQPT